MSSSVPTQVLDSLSALDSTFFDAEMRTRQNYDFASNCEEHFARFSDEHRKYLGVRIMESLSDSGVAWKQVDSVSFQIQKLAICTEEKLSEALHSLSSKETMDSDSKSKIMEIVAEERLLLGSLLEDCGDGAPKKGKKRKQGEEGSYAYIAICLVCSRC